VFYNHLSLVTSTGVTTKYDEKVKFNPPHVFAVACLFGKMVEGHQVKPQKTNPSNKTRKQ
jgi:hypothetical protein